MFTPFNFLSFIKHLDQINVKIREGRANRSTPYKITSDMCVCVIFKDKKTGFIDFPGTKKCGQSAPGPD